MPSFQKPFPSLQSKYPKQLLEEREEIRLSGSLRERIRFDLIDRPQHAFGLLAAADTALFCGIDTITIIEFGVADGEGLLNLCKTAELVTEETSVKFNIIGFDTGFGLPCIDDYRDHPEVWAEGDFRMQNKDQLLSALPENANILFGDIKDTIAPFVQELASSTPIGFVSFDIDIYSSTVSALKVFEGSKEQYLPTVISYFDDTLGGPTRIASLFRNAWSGQLLAINEFNDTHEHRKIDRIRTLPFRRPFADELWVQKMYGTHILDHSIRTNISSRSPLSMSEHGNIKNFVWPL